VTPWEISTAVRQLERAELEAVVTLAASLHASVEDRSLEELHAGATRAIEALTNRAHVAAFEAAAAVLGPESLTAPRAPQ